MGMRIGEVSRRSGVPIPTIRFYETRELLTEPARSRSGYRAYSQDVLNELGFIRRAQRLGFTLDEIRDILSIGRGGKMPCARVASLCAQHLDEIARKMEELKEFQRNLREAERLAKSGCGLTREGYCKAIAGASGCF